MDNAKRLKQALKPDFIIETSKLPWKVTEGPYGTSRIVDDYDRSVVTTDDSLKDDPDDSARRKTDAAFIVRAVNAHRFNMEVIKEIRHRIMAGLARGMPSEASLKDCIDFCEEAIAKTESK